jgi:hypothetical protein
VVDSSTGVIERLFDRMTARDWAGYGALLSADAERIGPWGDRMVGRDRYIEMISGPLNDGHRTTWDVHQIAYAPDGRSAFARVTAHLAPEPGAPFERFEETLAFEMDEEGLVCRVEVFWQTPWLAPMANARLQGNT